MPIKILRLSWAGAHWPTPERGRLIISFSSTVHPRGPWKERRMTCSLWLIPSHRLPSQPKAFSAAARLRWIPLEALQMVTLPSVPSLQDQVRLYLWVPEVGCMVKSANKMNRLCQGAKGLDKSSSSSWIMKEWHPPRQRTARLCCCEGHLPV